MKEFEEVCAENNIEPFVLPPKRPQWNGGVERVNKIFREGFYSKKDVLADSIQGLRYDLTKSLHKYNAYRPHFNFKGLTSYTVYSTGLSYGPLSLISYEPIQRMKSMLVIFLRLCYERLN